MYIAKSVLVAMVDVLRWLPSEITRFTSPKGGAWFADNLISFISYQVRHPTSGIPAPCSFVLALRLGILLVVREWVSPGKSTMYVYETGRQSKVYADTEYLRFLNVLPCNPPFSFFFSILWFLTRRVTSVGVGA